jgi:hypothetical protein
MLLITASSIVDHNLIKIRSLFAPDYVTKPGAIKDRILIRLVADKP